MGTFKVSGADRQTGEDVEQVVDAISEAAARLAANGSMLVSSVERMPGPLPYAGPTIPSPMPALPMRQAVRAPAYSELKFAARLVFIFAILSYFGGVVLIIISLLSLYVGQGEPAQTAIAGTMAIFWGGVLQCLSMACIALRDMARNSFRS